jgi:hypothetical protein
MERINRKATNYLNQLKRIENISNGSDSSNFPTLLFPQNADLFYTMDGVIKTKGLGVLDVDRKDLLTHIKILDPLNVSYVQTQTLMPRTYAESLDPIPHHISTQAIVLCRVFEQGKDQVLDLLMHTDYHKTSYDKIWVEDSNPGNILKPGEVLIIMNRRIGGWDGNPERPVIELLGGGGHLPTVWSRDKLNYCQMDPVESIVKEFKEELKYSLSPKNVDIIGGFHNFISNELVILCCVFVPFQKIVAIQQGALNNTDQNTDGIYLGTLRGVLKLYSENAESYAGGEKAKEANFPSKPELLRRIYNRLEIDA